MTRIITLAFLLLTYLPQLIAQSHLQNACDSILEFHYKLVDDIVGNYLFNPEDYVRGRLYYPRGTKDNHPFFPDFDWKPGYIESEGIQYKASMVKYDLEKDALILLKVIHNQGYSIELEKAVIRKFTIDNHTFIYLADVPKSGYYEELFNDEVSAWVKRTIWKKIDNQSDLKVQRYMTNIFFIIRKDNEIFEIKNLRELYEIYADHEHELRKFRKENQISFNNDPSYAVKKLTEYYNTLKAQ